MPWRPVLHVDRPRDVICHLHCYGIKKQIIKAAQLSDPVDFDGARIYPDFSRATLQRRAMLKPLLEALCRAELPYRWGSPSS